MSFVHGKSGFLKISTAAGSATDVSAYITDVSWPRNVDTSETTTFGVAGSTKTYISGLVDGSISVSGHWDATSTSASSIINGLMQSANPGGLTAGGPTTVVYGPAGGTTGLVSITVTAFVTSYEVSSSVGGLVEFKATLQPTAAQTVSTFP